MTHAAGVWQLVSNVAPERRTSSRHQQELANARRSLGPVLRIGLPDRLEGRMLNPPQPPHTTSVFGGPRDDTTTFADLGGTMSRTSPAPPEFVALAQSAEFQRLRRSLCRFVFPMSALFLGWYLAYVLVAAYNSEFMSTRLWGEINVGLVWGVAQFASTIGITHTYLRFASRKIDPKVTALRATAEGGDQQ
jgi:uncharacterized membrane protein (DUF485 family)